MLSVRVCWTVSLAGLCMQSSSTGRSSCSCVCTPWHSIMQQLKAGGQEVDKALVTPTILMTHCSSPSSYFSFCLHTVRARLEPCHASVGQHSFPRHPVLPAVTALDQLKLPFGLLCALQAILELSEPFHNGPRAPGSSKHSPTNHTPASAAQRLSHTASAL